MGIRRGLREMGLWPKEEESAALMAEAAVKLASLAVDTAELQTIKLDALAEEVRSALSRTTEAVAAPSPVNVTAGTQAPTKFVQPKPVRRKQVRPSPYVSKFDSPAQAYTFNTRAQQKERLKVVIHRTDCGHGQAKGREGWRDFDTLEEAVRAAGVIASERPKTEDYVPIVGCVDCVIRRGETVDPVRKIMASIDTAAHGTPAGTPVVTTRKRGPAAQPPDVSFANRSAGQKRRHKNLSPLPRSVRPPRTDAQRDDVRAGSATGADGWYANTVALRGGRTHSRADGTNPNAKYVFIHKPNCSRTRQSVRSSTGSRFTRFANTEDVNTVFADRKLWPTACPTCYNWYNTVPPKGWMVNLDNYTAESERQRVVIEKTFT